MKGTATIPGDALGLAADVSVEVEFDYSPGSAPVTGGPPEACDPGEPPEIEGIAAFIDGKATALSGDQDGKVVEWLFANHDFDVDDGPDPDDWYDQQRDDRLTGDA